MIIRLRTDAGITIGTDDSRRERLPDCSCRITDSLGKGIGTRRKKLSDIAQIVPWCDPRLKIPVGSTVVEKSVG